VIFVLKFVSSLSEAQQKYDFIILNGPTHDPYHKGDRKTQQKIFSHIAHYEDMLGDNHKSAQKSSQH